MAQLSDYLDVPRTVLQRLVESAERTRFPAVKIEEKWCADLADVQEWLLKRYEELKS